MWAWISLSNQGSRIIVRCSSSPLTCLTMLSCESIHTLTAVHEGHSTVEAGRTVHTGMVPTLVDVWMRDIRWVSEWVCEWVSEWVSEWVDEWVSDTESDSEREWHWERVTLRESDRARESEWTRENGWARESGLAGVTDRLTDWLTKVGTS